MWTPAHAAMSVALGLGCRKLDRGIRGGTCESDRLLGTIASMTVTGSGLPRPAKRLVGVLILLAALAPAMITTPFLAGQAWHSFTDPIGGTSAVWGAVCAALWASPFIVAPLRCVVLRRRGAPRRAAILAAAAAAFVVECAGLGLGMFTAALGGI